MSAAASLHLLCDELEITFRPQTYPGFTIRDGVWGDHAATISLTGDEAQRHAFAARLREMADLIDAWTEEIGRPSPVEEFTAPDPLTAAKAEADRAEAEADRVAS